MNKIFRDTELVGSEGGNTSEIPPSAEEYLNSKEFEPDSGISFQEYNGDGMSYIAVKAMKAFAELHVRNALKSAAEKAEIEEYESISKATFSISVKYRVDKESIINCYPKSLIK